MPIPNEPTQADVIRALCSLTEATLGMAAQLMEALEAGREHFPAQALPILEQLGRNFRRQKASTEAMLQKVAA